MKRRTLLKSIAAFVAARPLWPLDLFAQAPPLTDAHIATLRAVAEVVLPSSLARGPSATKRVRSLRRAGCATTRTAPTAATATATRGSSRRPDRRRPRAIPRSSPRSTRPRARAAARRSPRSPRDERRAVIEAALNDAAARHRAAGAADRREPRRRLHGPLLQQRRRDAISPTSAAIGRDTCRGLDGSEKAPRRLAEVIADMARFECDVVIIGGGITAAMVAQKLSELQPDLVDHRRRSRQAAVRLREPLRVPRSAISTTARTSGPATSSPIRAARGVDLAHDGGRRIGAALGRRVQSLLGGRHAAEVDVRPRRGLADRVERSREVLLRSRAAHRRVGRAEPAAGRRAVRAVSDAGDADDLQPDPAQGVGGEERHPVLDDAAGEEHGGRLRRPRQVPALQHLRSLSDRRALLAGLDVQAAARREEDPAARSDARAQARARRQDDEDRRGAGGRRKTARRRTSNTARRRSSSRPATAGARICCCSRRTRDFRTASRTRPTTSAAT